MKKIMNFSTSVHDTDRYTDNADLKSFYRGFGLDGIELLQAGADKRSVTQPDDVIGVHLQYYTAWLDLWKGDERRLLDEYGDYGEIEHYYGGTEASVITLSFIENLKFAASAAPEYMVFHVSECQLAESLLRHYHYTSAEVIDAAVQLADSITPAISGTPLLLFENLWYPGLDMLEPELTRKLLESTQYKNTGVMLDIGHLLHTNTALRTIDEGVDYIHRVLDGHSDLSFIKGIHLHQSLSGEYAERLMRKWVPGEGPYRERRMAVFPHIYNIDTHEPFCSERINEIIDRVQPEYLVLEQLSSDREEHSRKLREQLKYLR